MTTALTRASNSRQHRPVIHHHWKYDNRFNRTLYILRDGRDVVISLYWFHVRQLVINSRWRPRIERYFSECLGDEYDPDAVGKNLPQFIASLTSHPVGGMIRPRREERFLTWPEHVTDWVGRDGVHVVRYEDLLHDVTRELRGIRDFLELDVSSDEIEAIGATHSFEAQSGRPRGVEKRSSFMRRGISGEWREVFSREAGLRFEEYAGEVLRGVGYEASSDWLNQLPV